jgi:hypothetical protein
MDVTVTCAVIAPPLIAPPPQVLARARAIADAMPMPVDVDELLAVRAAMRGLTSRGRISAGGSCRLLPTTDGWIAVSLPRTTDVEAVPAIVERPIDDDEVWTAIEAFASTRSARAVADRCQLFEVAAAVLDDPMVSASNAVVEHAVGAAGALASDPIAVDLSAMWAGPLCARLLGWAGMRIVKVESVDRPDGVRSGDPQFYEWLHHGHEHRTLDFAAATGRHELLQLLREADVVIESSRPRALVQLGIDAHAIVAERPGRTWVSITGYGRSGDAAMRVAFGDDAAVAGGLVSRDHDGRPEFCGDAIADPLSGLLAAHAVLGSLARGGGHLVEVAMASVAKSFVEGA